MQIEPFADSLFKNFESFRVDAFPNRSFPPETFHAILDDLVAKSEGMFTVRTVGQSFENRPLRLVTAGTGPVTVLCWSQMHGDESTATMAIADILGHFLAARGEESTRTMLAALTLHFLPMLNPDGAARCSRRTAQGIDMNRDALAQRTPEARTLVQLQQQLHPDFAFNLHDQELSTVGSTKELTAVALLAPAYNAERTFNGIRTRAKNTAALIASVLNRYVPRRIARYDDTFEPRAFGDNMQKWGTSTVLVESGHYLHDPAKEKIRKLNAVGLLAGIAGIAGGKIDRINSAVYDVLPFNGSRAYDVVVRNVVIDDGNGRLTDADLGISSQVDTHSEPPARLVDLGDLHTFMGLKEIDGKKTAIPREALKLGAPFAWEQFAAP